MNEAIVLHTIRAVKEWRRLMGATPVIWTNGCFDLFHLGHVSFLNDAKMPRHCPYQGTQQKNPGGAGDSNAGIRKKEPQIPRMS